MNKEKFERYINYIVNDIEKPYFKNMEEMYVLKPEEYKFILSKLYDQPITIEGQRIFNSEGEVIYHELTNGYYGEKALMTYVEDSLQQGELFWYPHAWDDLHFLNDILIEKSITPSLIIMNDIQNIELNAEIPGWTVDHLDILYIEISQEELSHRSMACYSLNQESTGKRINLLYMSGVDSNDLLRYFCDTHLNVRYVFTHRAAGGLSFDLLSELNNIVFISDFHCIGDENIDSDSSDLPTVKSYAERLGFKVCDYIPSNRSNGGGGYYFNLLICEWENNC